MTNIIIPLAVIAVLLLIIVGAGLLIKAKLSKVSREMFGTSDIIKGLNEQNKQLSETPRSLHSMTDVERTDSGNITSSPFSTTRRSRATSRAAAP